MKKRIKELPNTKQRAVTELLPSVGGYRENKDLIDIVGRCLIFKPEKRIKVEEAVRHPFFRECRKPAREIDADFTYDDKLTFEHEGIVCMHVCVCRR